MMESKRGKPFGHIHFRHRMIHFQFRTHIRALVSISLFALAGLTSGWAMLRSEALRPAVLTARVFSPPATAPMTTTKQGRLPAPASNPDLLHVDTIEARIDGSFAQYAYFQTDVDFGPSSDQPRTQPDRAFAAPDARPHAEDAFASVLHDARPATTSRLNSMPLAYASGAAGEVRGVPINVTTSAKQSVDPVSHVMIMPAADQSLSAVLTGLRVVPAECRQLRESLGTSMLEAGEKFDAILADQADGRHIVMVRLQKTTGEDLILARVENDGFEKIRQPGLFERLMREATASASASERDEPVDVGNAADLETARSASPGLVSKLADGHVPADIIVQVVDLAQKNQIRVETDAELAKKVRLMFREGNGQKELVSVAFPVNGGERRFYRYAAKAGSPSEFFDADGHSVSKVLLKKPVPAGRLGDGFAWRIHPILGVRKHHNGVDYAAPLGSPILAAGDGVVDLISWEPGYGRYVRIRHDQGYFTTYAHIDRAAKGLAVGQRVSQGQVIALVGSTGLSTGPHLYYELRKGDHYYDPTATDLPAGTILTGERLAGFKNEVNRIIGIGNSMNVAAGKPAHKSG